MPYMQWSQDFQYSDLTGLHTSLILLVSAPLLWIGDSFVYPSLDK